MSFHQNKILTASDKRKYKDMYLKLLNDEKLKNPGCFSKILDEQVDKAQKVLEL